jgi:ketosteroid isomerase-like protein
VSRENVDIVRQAFAVRDSEGVEAALRLFASDVVWYTSDQWLEGSVYRGHEGLRAVEAMWAANIDDWAWALHDIREAGDRVVALSEMTGQIKGSGAPVSRRVGLVVSDIHDGLMGAVRVYSSWREALKAVGLEE